jgi:hypothetical protein
MTRLRRNPQVSETALDQEIFLVAPGNGEVYYLDAVTSGLWRLLAEPQSLADCQAAYRQAFPDQPGERVEHDVAAALAELERRKLILPDG